MKKKFLAIIGATVMTLACGLTACGSNDTLVVYTEAGFAPFEYVSDGKIVGVDVDIMNKVGEKLGKKVVFENVNFDTIIDAVAEGKLTNVGAAGISRRPDREAKVDFSKDYYTASLYVIYPAEKEATYVSQTTDNVGGVYWDRLVNCNIAVQKGTTADLFLSDEIAEGGTLWDEATGKATAQKTGFDALSGAMADVGLNCQVLIIDELPAKSLIKGKDNFACAPLYYKGSEATETEEAVPDEAAVDTYAICVTKGQTELLNAINAVLDELGEEGIQALVNKHLGL